MLIMGGFLLKLVSEDYASVILDVRENCELIG